MLQRFLTEVNGKSQIDYKSVISKILNVEEKILISPPPTSVTFHSHTHTYLPNAINFLIFFIDSSQMPVWMLHSTKGYAK